MHSSRNGHSSETRIHWSTQRLSDHPVNIKYENYNAPCRYDCCVMSKPRLYAPFDVRASFIWYHSTTLHYESAVLMQSVTEFLSIFSRLRPIRLLLYKSFLVLSLLTLNALSWAHCHDFTFSAYLMADQSDISSDLGSFLSGTVFFFYLRNTVCSKRESGSRIRITN